MKITVIGDIHGHNSWKKISEQESNSDKIIFLGDYFDSFSVSPDVQLSNFKEIVQFKNDYLDKVELLLGNHDGSYCLNNNKCSGYNKYTHSIIGSLLYDLVNDSIVKLCYKHDNFIFSHAGITKTWCRNNNIIINDKIDKSINNLIFNNRDALLFQGSDFYGDNVTQSLLWVRPKSLSLDNIDNYWQIVGHTHYDFIKFNNNCVICDSLPNEYLVIENNNKFNIKQLSE